MARMKEKKQEKEIKETADWLEMNLEENEQYTIETISLDENLEKLEEELENRGYRIEKNGSFWTIRRNNK
jgi:hypothetical protein